MRSTLALSLSLALLASLAVPRAHAQCFGPCPGAGQPCYQTSTVPPVIVGGGSCVGGVTAVPFKVVVRDATGLPLPGVRVVIDFSTVVGPTHGNQLQISTQQVLCPSAWLVRATDATGTATFYPQFYGCATGPAIQVTGNGFCLGFVAARSTDVQATPTAVTNVADLAVFAAGLADFTIFAQDFTNATPSAYCSSGW